jgi:hypothetical protein
MDNETHKKHVTHNNATHNANTIKNVYTYMNRILEHKVLVANF